MPAGLRRVLMSLVLLVVLCRESYLHVQGVIRPGWLEVVVSLSHAETWEKPGQGFAGNMQCA